MRRPSFRASCREPGIAIRNCKPSVYSLPGVAQSQQVRMLVIYKLLLARELAMGSELRSSAGVTVCASLQMTGAC